MTYINVDTTLDGQRFKTKKKLKEALTSMRAKDVMFAGTSGFAPFQGTIADVPEGTVLVAVGPNPYLDRRWYANITVSNGYARVV